ncbi:hypothetical protein ACM26V_07595 [Salipaludibacillus sp. HK11]|uniref:hypothetical protein n=1 Tax=Salipaludibacillus sp. HK11 TaxID=3394320 RepID=UPI0039FCB953
MDFDTNAVVSVVTNQTSDDTNGCNIEGDMVWLQVARVNNAFSLIADDSFAAFENLPDPIYSAEEAIGKLQQAIGLLNEVVTQS